MHRVLSYQTAMRAGGSRDIREYVTKRTCVSLVLSIAFFTLIAGFLLGKFVSDRQHHINHYHELNEADEYLGYTESKELLINVVKEFSIKFDNNNINTNITEQHSIINTKIYNNYIKCIQELPTNLSIKIDNYVQNLLNNQISRQLLCLSTLKEYIKTL